MTLFWSGAGVLLFFAVLMLAAPVMLARRAGETVSARAENLRAHREHLSELEAQGAAGELGGAELQPLREELEYTLLLESGAEADAASSAAQRETPRWVAPVLLSLALVGCAGFLYGHLGAARDWQLARQIESVVAATDQATRLRRLDDLVAGLERKAATGDAGTTALYLLARSQMELGRYPEAVRAYNGLVEENPDAPQLLAEYAQARYAASGRVLGPETADILRRVLQLDPHNQSALGLLGLGQFNHGDYAAALRYWERALAGATDPAGRHALQAGIAQARERMNLPPETPATQDAGPVVQVAVSLSEAAAGNLAEGAAVFVFARRVDGPRMPLAAARLRPAELPRTVRLDDRSAMMEGMDLSSAGDEVEVQARLTFSGQPLPQSGDWESASVRVRLREQAAPAALVIDTRLP